MSSNDFNGPRRPAGGNGYAPPEGWGDDGFWRDSAVDADYETGAHQAVNARGASAGTGPRAARGNGQAPTRGAGQPAQAGYQNGARGYGPPNGGPGPNGAPGPGGASGPNGAPDATRVHGGPGQRGGRGQYTGPARNGAVGHGDATRIDANGAATRVDRVPPGMRPGGPGRRGPGGPGRRGPGGPGGPRRPGYGPRGPVKGSWWRTWTWKKALAVGGASLGGLVVIIALAGFYMYSTTSIPAALASVQQQNSIVYYSDGTTEMGTIGTVNRTDLALNQIPVTLQDAFLAAEDKNFYHEGGVSPTGIMRAALADVTSGGGSLNGGSTITQEFVRNYYGLGLQQTASRKIKEIIISEKLAGTKSKQWILQNYLNVVYLGAQSYGIQAAAETYFGKSVSQLTIGEQAVLAGLPQAPSAYPLLQYKTSLETRWQYVMAQMVRDGFITQAQASAQKFPTLLTWADPARGEMASNINAANPNNPWEPYLLGQVENELTSQDHVTQGQLQAGGMKIVTNISLPEERDLYNAVNTTLSSSNLRANGSQFSKLPLWALTGAQAQNPSNGAIVAEYPGKGQNQSPSDCQQNSCDVNNVTQQTEQVGSSFKPYVLSAAVQQGMNVQSSVMDTSPYACIAPASMGSTVFSQPVTPAIYHQASSSSTAVGCPSSAYFPEENDSGELIGKTAGMGNGTNGTVAGAQYYSDTVQDALAMSSNVAFTDLIHRTGTDAPAKIAEEVGADPKALAPFRGQVGMALGEAPMTVQDQASLIAMLDDNGTFHTAHLIQYWEDTTAGTKNMPTVTSNQVLTPAQASQVQYAMEMTTVNGTAKGLVQMSQDGRQVIGKTGTTTSNHSGYFIGGIPQFAMAVGMFTTSISNKSQNLGLLDSSNAANIYPTMIWNAFANAAYGNTTPESFQQPQFSGAKWDMLGSVPKAPPKPKPQQPKTPGHGHKGANPFPTGPGFPSSGPSTPSSPCAGILCSQPSQPPASPTAPSSPTNSPPPGHGGGGGGGG